MRADQIQRVCVVGAGQMGSGIAQVCAEQGLEVVLSDVSQPHAERALERMQAGLDRLVSKGKIGRRELADTLRRLRAAPECRRDFFNDTAATEKDPPPLLAALPIFARFAQPNALLCSNASSIS